MHAWWAVLTKYNGLHHLHMYHYTNVISINGSIKVSSMPSAVMAQFLKRDRTISTMKIFLGIKEIIDSGDGSFGGTAVISFSIFTPFAHRGVNKDETARPFIRSAPFIKEKVHN